MFSSESMLHWLTSSGRWQIKELLIMENILSYLLMTNLMFLENSSTLVSLIFAVWLDYRITFRRNKEKKSRSVERNLAQVYLPKKLLCLMFSSQLFKLFSFNERLDTDDSWWQCHSILISFISLFISIKMITYAYT